LSKSLSSDVTISRDCQTKQYRNMTTKCTEYDDISNLPVPNTAEEFLRMLLINMQGLNKRVRNMEAKLDKFLSKFEDTHTVLGDKEGTNLASDISNLADDISQVSVRVMSPKQPQEKVKSGVILTVGETYVDPNLISNMTKMPVSTQPLNSEQDINIKESDLIIIQPSSDICEQLDNPDFRKIESDVKQYIDTALDIVYQHPDTHVFISSLPPRYDNGEASRSTELWNNILVTETFVHDNVHAVSQSGLECKEGKKRFERYNSDGFLLTPYGTKLLSKNIGTSIMGVIGSMQKEKISEKPLKKLSVRRKSNQYLVKKLISALVS
jgi:hypothetical protein